MMIGSTNQVAIASAGPYAPSSLSRGRGRPGWGRPAECGVDGERAAGNKERPPSPRRAAQRDRREERIPGEGEEEELEARGAGQLGDAHLQEICQVQAGGDQPGDGAKEPASQKVN